MRVVILPDVIARSFHDPDCKALLDYWRDGIIRPVLNHELLVLYARVLRQLGVPDSVVRRWLLWFTAENKSECSRKNGNPISGLRNIAIDAARAGGATFIVTDSVDWLPPRAETEIPEGIPLMRVTQYLTLAREGRRP
jgi:hypothetical protein